MNILRRTHLVLLLLTNAPQILPSQGCHYQQVLVVGSSRNSGVTVRYASAVLPFLRQTVPDVTVLGAGGKTGRECVEYLATRGTGMLGLRQLSSRCPCEGNESRPA